MEVSKREIEGIGRLGLTEREGEMSVNV